MNREWFKKHAQILHKDMVDLIRGYLTSTITSLREIDFWFCCFINDKFKIVVTQLINIFIDFISQNYYAGMPGGKDQTH